MNVWMCRATVMLAGLVLASATQAQPARVEYRVLATNKTSTMQKELSEAAAAGFRFGAVMGGETSFGGAEAVVVMQRVPGATRAEYRLLATSKTSTMQKELQEASDAGFEYVGQTVFRSTFGGAEVACILERAVGDAPAQRYQYRLLATKRTSTLEKELQDAGGEGFEIVGMTVGQTAMGGNELVAITRRKVSTSR
ncbi:MAG: hypothetical protein IT182_03250 [Acidobacteria bacterium]|nr:hypothetical protein [Acidobacteriota bacterium]